MEFYFNPIRVEITLENEKARKQTSEPIYTIYAIYIKPEPPRNLSTLAQKCAPIDR